MPYISALLLVCAGASIFAAQNVENSLFPNLFYNFFAKEIQSQYAKVLINYGVLAICLIILNFITLRQEIVEKQNFFPLFLFAVLNVAAIQPGQLNAQILTNFFILISLYKILKSYREEFVLNEIFESSFYISLSAFISFTAIINFPVYFIALSILRPFNWKEWIVALIGFLAPVFIYESIAYLSNFNQWYFIKAAKMFFNDFKFPTFSEYYLPLVAIIVLLFIAALFKMFSFGLGNTVKKQKAKTIFLWFTLFNIFGILSGGMNSSELILIFSIPFAFILGDFFYSIKQTKISNTLLTLLFICILIVYLASYNLI
ncbi:MAG: hypothetical protein IPM51_00810 [Sphingobacteriaceae bacterium]|nr:hypothetical protein [Sphingobacteriaceae bacterium]